MSQKLHQHTFTWPATNATNVIVTGTFDNWSQSVTMQRSPEGGFVAHVDVPWDTAIFYKFVQDGNWLIDSQQEQCDDGSGQVNNYYKSPKAPAFAANNVVEPEATLPADKGEVQPAAITEPASTLNDHVNEGADPAVPASLAEAEVLPLAAAVEHLTDIVPEAATGPATHADPPVSSLPVVEVLPSSDALPTTAPIEPATSEPPIPAAVEETAPAPVVEAAPAPVLEAAPTPIPETAPTPVAETAPTPPIETAPTPAVEEVITPVVEAPPTPAVEEVSVPAIEELPTPAAEEVALPTTEEVAPPATDVVPVATVDDIVYATANTDATADAVVAAAKEAALTTTPAVTTDVVAPATTEATPAKVDAAVAEDKPTASPKPTSETPAKLIGERKDAKAVGELKDAKAPTTPPANATKTEETEPAKPRLDGKGKGDRQSRTYTSIKDKLFPSLEHEKVNGVSEHGDGQIQTSASTESSPTREKRRSFFGRVVSIFKPSS